MRYCILCLFSISLVVASAQTPSCDKNWYLESEMSDEFSGTQINSNKWSRCMSWGDCDIADDGTITKCSDDQSLYELSGGVLTLYAKKQSQVCKKYEDGVWKYFISQYTEGALFSKNRYGYGYFEIRCKLPQVYKYRGINPSFWLFGQAGGDPYSWNEIDIYEFNGHSNTHTCNVHYMDKTMVPKGVSVEDAQNDFKWELRTNENKKYHDFPVDFSDKGDGNKGFHTFGCEWTPNYIKIYCDGSLVNQTDMYCRKLQPMIMYVTMGILNEKFQDKENRVTDNKNWPYSYQIDYIRYYTLDFETNVVVNTSNFNFDKSYYSVKKSITLKNSTVPKNGKYTLRATDFIELQGDFTVPLGSELAIIPTAEY